MQSFINGCVIAAVAVMVWLAYSQKHHQCWNGHIVQDWRQHVLKKTDEPCGSMGPATM